MVTTAWLRRIPLLSFGGMAIATASLAGCDFALVDPVEYGPTFSIMADCDNGFTQQECDAIETTYDELLILHGGGECEEVILSSQSRWNDGEVHHGGSSTSIHGYHFPGGETVYITTYGLEEIGPTLIHEEAHLIYSHASHEDIEAIGQYCGSIPA